MRNCEGWDAFKLNYPNVVGLILLSKVGFNHERTQALVYMEELFKAYGYGNFIFLKKPNKSWNIAKTARLWHTDYGCD